MKEPTSIDELNARYMANTKFSGYGLETKVHHPCPACGAPDWQVGPVIDFQEEIEKDRTCAECGRSFKGIVNRRSGGIEMEVVQTGGPDLPDWYEPKMRRV